MSDLCVHFLLSINLFSVSIRVTMKYRKPGLLCHSRGYLAALLVKWYTGCLKKVRCRKLEYFTDGAIEECNILGDMRVATI